MCTPELVLVLSPQGSQSYLPPSAGAWTRINFENQLTFGNLVLEPFWLRTMTAMKEVDNDN